MNYTNKNNTNIDDYYNQETMYAYIVILIMLTLFLLQFNIFNLRTNLNQCIIKIKKCDIKKYCYRSPKLKKRWCTPYSNLDNIELDEDIICSICYEELLSNNEEIIYRLKCDHYFHEKCIQEWFNTTSENSRERDNREIDNTKTCPLCKTKIKLKKYYL